MRKDDRKGLYRISWIMVLDNPAACARAWCIEQLPHEFSYICPQVIFVFSFSTTTSELAVM